MGKPPPPSQDWGTPSGIDQQSEYLLHGGQYASRGHVGGLSCSLFKSISALNINLMQNNKLDNIKYPKTVQLNTIVTN